MKPKKSEVLLGLLVVGTMIGLLVMFPLYRTFMLITLGPIPILLLVRLMTHILVYISHDIHQVRSDFIDVGDRLLNLEVKQSLIDQRLYAIGEVSSGKLKMMRPSQNEIKQLGSGEVVNNLLPDYFSISNLRPKNSLREIIIGLDEEGRPVYADMTQWIHSIILGDTNSGKSNFAHILLSQIMMSREPVTIDLIDFASATFYDFDIPYVREMDEAEDLFARWFTEYDRRIALFASTKKENGLGCPDWATYNSIVSDPLPFSFLFIEEASGLFASEQITEYFGRLLKLSRKAGLQMILISQSAKSSELPTEYRSQFQTRIQFPTKERTLRNMVINTKDCDLSRTGRGVFDINGINDLLNVQTPAMDDSWIIKARDTFNGGNLTLPEETYILNLDEDSEDEQSGTVPEISAHGRTQKEIIEDYAEKARLSGYNPEKFKAADVFESLEIHNNGANNRIWNKAVQNGLAK